MPVPLGPFELVRTLAKGGMGEVWAARHLEQRLEVAIKVITADFARHPGFQASLRQEVRAMASLSHPHIVRVFDQGEVDGEAARASDYQLVEGSPYIAMEMVRGPTLADFVLALPWEDVRTILVKLLDALGHAHGRNVLHRDLKPANLLLPEGGTTWQIRLTDFGIAHPLHGDHREGPRVAGTPHFMAPEQRRGDWRRYRPATDLFAVGRIASAMLVREEDGRARVPPGFNAWMARILAATPQHRFAFAADAAWALRSLGEPTELLDLAFDPGRPAVSVRSTANTRTHTFSTEQAPEEEEPVRELLTTTFDHAERPVLPATWRASSPKPPTRQMKNAGRGLFGLRTTELVGRNEERDRLWALLHRVHRDGAAHLVLIRGAEGVGKASLVRWLSERAYETGGGWPMHAAFSPLPGDADPLSAMVANELNTLGLTRDEAVPFVRELAELFGETDPYDVEALAEIANPAGPRSASVFRFTSKEERSTALARFLRWTAERRPVICHLEDVQWGGEGLAMARVALEMDAASPAPILFAFSADDAALATCPMERQQLEELKARAGDRFHEITLEPLPPTDQRRLVASLLGLDPTLVARTADQTEGNPLHAVQLVTRWLEAGALREGPDGLDLVDEEAMGSGSVEDLWKHRLTAFLEERPDHDRVALELLAVLGREVPAEDWQRLTRRAGFRPSEGLIERMVESGMLRAVAGDRYAFAHVSLRQAVLDGAEAASRLTSHHQNCADLVKRYALGHDRDGRVGEHLLYGGRPQAALHYLQLGADGAVQEGDAGRAQELLVLWHRAIASLDLPVTDARHGDGIELETRAALGRYDLTEARRQAERLRNRAMAHGWKAHHARALMLLGKQAFMAGDLDRAERELEAAAGHAEQARDPAAQAESLYNLAQLRMQAGDTRSSASLLGRARALYLEARDADGEVRSLLASAMIAQKDRRPDEALTLADAGRQLAAKAGSRVRQAQALIVAGEVHRGEGRLELAEKAYRVAVRILRSCGGPNRSIVCELNIAQVLQDRDDHQGALEIIGACIDRLHRTGQRSVEAAAHALMLPSLAQANNRIAFERHLSAAQSLFRDTGFRDPDAVKALDRGSAIAREHGWDRPATRAALLAQTLRGHGSGADA